jgi:hypothetical protein
MDDLKQLVNFTGNCLENGKPCILALKISGEKSTSSADRARMVMAADGRGINCHRLVV